MKLGYRKGTKVSQTEEGESKVKLFSNYFTNLSYGKLSIKDQAFFAKRLSFLIKAGVPILESLHMLRDQTISKGYKKMLDVMISDVSNGQPLSSSLAKFKNGFGVFALNIISVGEQTGVLSENLTYLAEELKKRELLRRKVVGALVYPIFITIATLGITAMLTVFIFPKIMPIFMSLNVDLPLSTVILISVSDFLRNYGLWLLPVLIGILIFFRQIYIRNYKFHFFFDSAILKTPLIGEMIKNYNMANMSRTLSLLLNGGMTLSESIIVTYNSTGNLVYKEELAKLSKIVDRGEKISTHMKNYRKLFPDILSQIISVGERSGNLSETLTYLSEMYENEVEDSTKNLSSLIEPVLMVLMGIMVGFVAISIITPIYSITQGLQP